MTATLDLPARLDTAAAPALAEDLRRAAGGDIVLDATATMMIGALCLEAILAAAKDAADAGHSLNLTGADAALADQLGLFGLSPDTLMPPGDAP